MGILARISRTERRSITWEPFSGWFGGKASSGETVTRETSITLSPYWRALNLISNDLAKLRVHVFEHDGDDRHKATDHPAYNLLSWKANDEIGAFTFRQVLQAQALSEGNGYAFIKRNGAGEPISLWPLDAQRTWPVRYNGILSYVAETYVDKQGDPVSPAEGDRGIWKQLPVAAEDMIHIRGLGFDGLQGYRVLDLAREVLGLGIVQRKHESTFFRNSTMPRGVLEFPGTMNETTKTNLVRTWEEFHGTAEKAHRTAVLDRGMKFSAISFSAADSQLIQAKEFNILEIANITGIPPHKLGHTARTSYSSLESENQSYLDNCLSHWIVVWQQELWDKLLTEEEKSSHSHTIDFDWSDLVRADTAQRYSAHHNALLDGWKCRDEVRGEEGYNPMPDSLGKEFFQPLNVGIAGKPAPGTPEPGAGKNPFMQDFAAPDAGISDAVRFVHADAYRRAVRRLGQHATRAAKDGKAFMNWLDNLEEQKGPMDDILSPSLELALVSKSIEPRDALRYSRELLAWTRHELLELAGDAKASELERSVSAFFSELETRCGGPGSGIPGPCPLAKDVGAIKQGYSSAASKVEKKLSAFAKAQIDAALAGQPIKTPEETNALLAKAEKAFKNSVIRGMSELGSKIMATYGANALQDSPNIWNALKDFAKTSVANWKVAAGTQVDIASEKPNYPTTFDQYAQNTFNSSRDDMKNAAGGFTSAIGYAMEAFKAKYGY